MLNNTIPRTLRRAVPCLVAGLVGGLLALPVQAGGVQLSLSARNSQEALALQTAVALYALHRDIRTGADLRQIGQNNAALLEQGGAGNRAIIRQRGANHSAALRQTGGSNSQILLQFGRGAVADIVQTGGEAGILIQLGR